MKLTPYQIDVIHAKICPYCKSKTKLISETDVYGKEYKGRKVIACINFPSCDSYVGTHDIGEALGRLANKTLRTAKKNAHYWFDKIWRNGYKKRGSLYAKLSDFLDIPSEYTHIGMFSKNTCNKTESWAKSMYQELLAESNSIKKEYQSK